MQVYLTNYIALISEFFARFVTRNFAGYLLILGDFCDFAAKNRDFKLHFNHISHFLKPYE